MCVVCQIKSNFLFAEERAFFWRTLTQVGHFPQESRRDKYKPGVCRRFQVRAFGVYDDLVLRGIGVEMDPTPRVVLGSGFPRPTYVALGREDAGLLLAGRWLVPCLKRGQVEEKSYWYKEFSPSRLCEQCGISYSPWVNQRRHKLGIWARCHPVDGCMEIPVVTDAGVMPLYGEGGEPNGRYLLVKPDPRIQDDNRALVCWRFPSGNFGASRILIADGVRVVAQGVRRLECPRFGEVAEMMAILNPGQELRAHRSGSRTHAVLRWDGRELSVLTGGPEVFDIAETRQKELVAS